MYARIRHVSMIDNRLCILLIRLVSYDVQAQEMVVQEPAGSTCLTVDTRLVEPLPVTHGELCMLLGMTLFEEGIVCFYEILTKLSQMLLYKLHMIWELLVNHVATYTPRLSARSCLKWAKKYVVHVLYYIDYKSYENRIWF